MIIRYYPFAVFLWEAAQWIRTTLPTETASEDKSLANRFELDFASYLQGCPDLHQQDEGQGLSR
jgi:hypothetical protein